MVDINELEKHKDIDFNDPVLLFKKENHSVYWVGITNETAFRCNAYLICDGDENILIDPSSRSFFGQVRDHVAKIVDPKKITKIFIGHQDPDVAASIEDWVTMNPNITIFGSGRVFVMLPHYNVNDIATWDTDENPKYKLPSGNVLEFYSSPFLHSPMATTMYDTASKYLFSGDIFAALDVDWELIVSDFALHIGKMNLFHLDYMASNLAARGYVDKIMYLKMDGILPQHGSIIPAKFVPNALEYLRNLKCGADLCYAYLT